MNAKTTFEVGDLVRVLTPNGEWMVSPPPDIRAGIVIKKMKTKNFYVVYSKGKYHTNVYWEWMEKLA